MMRRLNHLWRIVATGVSFFLFGLGGVILWLVYFPLLNLFIADTSVRRRYARRTISRAFGWFLVIMRSLGVCRYSFEGVHELARPGQIVVANHPTLLDVVFLISQIPDADCVVRSGLAKNVFTRGPVRAAGYICNDQGEAMIEDCLRSLERGSSLVFFPEGTRTKPGIAPKLQRGVANLALRGNLPIRPVRIRCTPPTLSKGQKWYLVPSQRFQIDVRVLPELSPALVLQEFPDRAHQSRAFTRLMHSTLFE